MAEAEMELVLRQPLGEPPFQLFPSLCENGESTCITFGFPLAVDRETDPTVMMLLTDDKEEIEAGKKFTQCDRIKESNCIFLSQYIELLRSLRHNRLLDKKLVDIKPYVLLLQRLPSKLVQFHPKNDNTRVPICIHPKYCLIKEHLHFCPYAFLKALGDDLSYTNKVILRLEDPPDDVELQVTQDLDMCTDNLQRVVDLLQRRHEN